ncbi:hypothetical protein FACS1894176_08850 [Bacteroidia bacterium]|nr:hypothetical protein FACS1894176_08850 [Bacteroidia bacterium]
MKTKLFLLLMSIGLLATASLLAQETSNNSSLTGVWQFCMPLEKAVNINPLTEEISLDSTKLMPGPVFKILGPSGDFVTLSLSPRGSHITAYGTYTIVSTDNYVEHITQSYTDPVYNNGDNSLSYQLVGNNYCVISYPSPKMAGKTAQEVWKRVTGFNPAEFIKTQAKPIVKGEKDEKGNYMAVDEMPQFPGGQQALTRFLQKNLYYPSNAKDKKSGFVLVRFVVNTDGKAEQIEVIRSLAPEFDQEAVRVIQLMPEWNSGKHEGKAVPVYYSLPIRFQP